MMRLTEKREGEKYSAAARLDRREALKWFLSATGLAAMPGESWPASGALNTPPAGVTQGYGTDPDLLRPHVPWSRTLTDEQVGLLRFLADQIIPADDVSPSAGEAGVVDFIDEWVSAPYPEQQRDRGIILAGLQRLNAASRTQHNCELRRCSPTAQAEILRKLARPSESTKAPSENETFFSRLRYLVAGGFYTSPVGLSDLKYVGDEPVVGDFPGPPPAAIASLNVALRELKLNPVFLPAGLPTAPMRSS